MSEQKIVDLIDKSHQAQVERLLGDPSRTFEHRTEGRHELFAAHSTGRQHLAALPGIGMLGPPVAGDIDPAAEPHAVMFFGVIDEALEGGDAPGPAA